MDKERYDEPDESRLFRKLKIVYFLDFPFGLGGANKVLLKQAHIMRQRGHQVLVVIVNDKEDRHAPEYDQLCREYNLETTTARLLMATSMEEIDILDALEKEADVEHILAGFNPDMIHSTQLNIAVELAARSLGIPHIMNIYPADKEEFTIAWMDIYPHYHCADSELFSTRWRDGLQITSKCIRVAYESGGRPNCNTIAAERQNRTLHFLSIGAIYEGKNQLEIIKAVLLCKKSGIGVVLTFLGNDTMPYGEMCKRFVKDNHLENEVIFKGFIMNVEDYFEQADLFILASVVESYPGVIVESMANGVPVLSTPVAGVPELLQDGCNGFLTSGYSSEDIYEAIKRYLIYREKDKIPGIINQAYDTYQNHHSYEAVGAGLEGYYNWILGDYYKNRTFIDLDKIREIFTGFIGSEKLQSINRYTKAHLWYLYHINEKIKRKPLKRIVIWGAGYLGGIALEWIKLLNCEDQLIGFVDMCKKGTYLDYPILEKREDIIETCDMVLAAVGDTDSRIEIMVFLDKCGKKRNEDYFMILNSPIRI